MADRGRQRACRIVSGERLKLQLLPRRGTRCLGIRRLTVSSCLSCCLPVNIGPATVDFDDRVCLSDPRFPADVRRTMGPVQGHIDRATRRIAFGGQQKLRSAVELSSSMRRLGGRHRRGDLRPPSSVRRLRVLIPALAGCPPPLASTSPLATSGEVNPTSSPVGLPP